MGWIASVLTFVGLLLNARQVRASWLLWLFGNALWITHAWGKDHSIVALNVGFVFVNLYGYYSWRSKDAAPAPEAQTEDDCPLPDCPCAACQIARARLAKAAAHAGYHPSNTPCPTCGEVACRNYACFE